MNRVLDFAAYYVEREQPDKALAIYHNVNSFFPNSVRVYEAMGRAYLASDQRWSAIDSYSKAIELADAHGDGRLTALETILADLQ